MTASIDISVAIVSYNTRDLLRECLRSLQAHSDEANLEIIVIDNASRDDSAQMVQQEFPAVKLIQSAHNSGYGAANNRALENARGEYVWILNSDTTVESGALSVMLDWMREHPRCGAIGTRLILADGATQNSYHFDLSWHAVFAEQFYLDKLLPSQRYTVSDWKRGARAVPYLCGASLLVRRAAWHQLGGFDESYFMYFEDIDLCARLRQAGWELWYLPEANVHHHLGASSERDWRDRARMVAHYNRGRLRFLMRHRALKTARRVQILLIAGALGRLIFWLLRALLAPSSAQRRHCRAQIKLFRHVWQQTRHTDLNAL